MIICSCVVSGSWYALGAWATDRPARRDCAVSFRISNAERNRRTLVRPPYFGGGSPDSTPTTGLHCTPARHKTTIINPLSGWIVDWCVTLAWMYMETMLSRSTSVEHLDSQKRRRPSSWKKLAAAISSRTSFWLTSRFSQPPLYK